MQQRKFTLNKVAALCLTTTALLTSASALAEAPPSRFIIKYKNAVPATLAQEEATLTSLPANKRLQVIQKHVREDLSSLAGMPLEIASNAHSSAQHHIVKANRKLSAKETQEMLKNLAQDPSIESVEEDALWQIAAVPNDTQYTNQWHYYETTGGLNLPLAWDTATGAGVVTAVLDTGYRPHADLVANILPGYDMISDATVGNDGNARDSDARDPGDWVAANECGGTHSASNSSWHGTHVAGTVAAQTNNSSGVAGVAYNSKIVPVRVLGKCGGYTSDIADGIIWAAGGTVSGVPANPNPAKVINLSLGGSGACPSVTQNAINTAVSLGAVVVVAAGNSNAQVNASSFTPANCNNVITVSATNRSGGRAYYSNYSTTGFVDVAAPGGAQSSANDPNGVLSTLNSGTTTPGTDNYAYFQGTSMAAPHVAGVAALMLEANPTLSPANIKSILTATARSFPATCSGCGTGIVDAKAAVEMAVTGAPTTPVVTETLTGLSIAASAWRYYSVTLPAGTSSFQVSISGGTGDADLYVRQGAQPTTSSYNCRPYLTGNSESCSFSSPASGTWHIGIRGYSAATGLTLTYSYQ